MLTRLRVNGFKNLVDVDVRFGPFTCVAGANGAGKSNLFDAITFLSALASRPLMDAALTVRDEGGRTTDVQNLFHRVGDRYDREMAFGAEMIVPSEGIDDLGKRAEASITFLRYALTLAYRTDDNPLSLGELEIVNEELTHIRLGDAGDHLRFPHSPAWRRSAVKGKRTSPFISTEQDGSHRLIKLHQERRQGRPLTRLATDLPRTMLSSASAAESPTALLARREMQSWRLLQLEPSALREPDKFRAPTTLGVDGSHIASTLYHLAYGAKAPALNGRDIDEAEKVFAQVANRLAELLDDVRAVSIDRDEQRQLLTLQVTDHEGTSHPARSLSDGTLRFLALAVLDLEAQSPGLLCLEEPENGIHPARIPAMLRLLEDIATDTEEIIDQDNPLRQVIINTHSPSVVSQVPDDSLLFAESREMVKDGQRFRGARFGGLSDTWRVDPSEAHRALAKGDLMAYLYPVQPGREVPIFGEIVDGNGSSGRSHRQRTRVADREDLQLMIPFPVAQE